MLLCGMVLRRADKFKPGFILFSNTIAGKLASYTNNTRLEIFEV